MSNATSSKIDGGSQRKYLQQRAKALGLPANATTEKICSLIDIADKPPSTWTPEEFRAIAPYLSIHQDLRENSDQRVESIMREGLNRGMVDSLDNWVNKRWTWAKGRLSTGNAYLFLSGTLKFRSKESPHIAKGSIPFYHFKTKVGQDLYEAITQSASE